jgi:hypothetical protein
MTPRRQDLLVMLILAYLGITLLIVPIVLRDTLYSDILLFEILVPFGIMFISATIVWFFVTRSEQRLESLIENVVQSSEAGIAGLRLLSFKSPMDEVEEIEKYLRRSLITRIAFNHLIAPRRAMSLLQLLEDPRYGPRAQVLVSGPINQATDKFSTSEILQERELMNQIVRQFVQRSPKHTTVRTAESTVSTSFIVTDEWLMILVDPPPHHPSDVLLIRAASSSSLGNAYRSQFDIFWAQSKDVHIESTGD